MLDSNIRQEYYPELYESAKNPTDRSISQAVIEDEKRFRQRILHRLSSLGDEDDASKDPELLVAAGQLRLASKVGFNLGNNKMLT